jgi:hypothetical protein
MAKQAELTGMEGNRKLQDLHDAGIRPVREAGLSWRDPRSFPGVR